MEKLKKILTVLIGSLLIALGLNLFILPNHFLPFGALGTSLLIEYIGAMPVYINLLVINLIVILMAYLVFDKKIILKYVLSSFMIPVLLFLTKDVNSLLNINLKETMLSCIVGGALCGYGYSMIFKVGERAGVTFLLEEIIGHLTKFHSKMYSWFFDIIIITVFGIIYGVELSLYSIIIIVISKFMITKARFGISDSKMFYIITSKEKEVEHFIIHDLKYELTVIDVKGGFTKKDNKIFLSIISTGDYYRLKEGIKLIDPDAFIAIADTYDVVNRKAF